MLPAVELLQAGWHDLIGWMLIVSGTALALDALGLGRTRHGVAHLLRAYRPADWRQHHGAHGRARPLTGDHRQWRILEAIAERGFAQAEMAADLHARAQLELDAVEAALTSLLAQHLPAGTPSRAGVPLPAPAPLAA
ncbi:MAG: hypothetical protein J2P51_04040 [Hyphomicrobiaceae bacterium]|nr:hypothetical protein [Hyphomicrobiaceae bacterium]